MISKSWSRKSIATVVAVAVLSVYSMLVLAAPRAKASGALAVSGQVKVNGQKMISGGTIFMDSIISTADQSSASVSISKVGRVDLAANSNLRLSFAANGITAMLETGSAQVAILAGITVNLTTKDGTVVVDGSQPTTFTVSASRERTSVATLSGIAQFRAGGSTKQIAAGESATAGVPNPRQDTDDGSWSWIWFVIPVVVAVTVISYVVFDDNDDELNFGGSITVSQSR
jgi:ferric-dicitrate binding protein FerR (iron transport regulator)